VQPPVTTGALAPLNVLSFTTNTVTATIGGAPATVVFAGLAPGFAGLYQVNMLVPQLSPGRYPLQVSIGGTGSNTAYINIQ
jgi:adhesin/invasin